MDEEDAVVYRRPYLTSGSSGFALTAISRMLKKGLKVSFSYVYKSLLLLRFPFSNNYRKCTNWLMPGFLFSLKICLMSLILVHIVL
jgi:hypothetical protein